MKLKDLQEYNEKGVQKIYFKDTLLLYTLINRLGGGFEFCAVEFVSHPMDKEQWSDETEIMILFHGDAFNDGIRHLYFGDERTDNYGYSCYPNMEELKELIGVLSELEKEHC